MLTQRIHCCRLRIFRTDFRKRLRSYVLKRFLRFRTFAHGNVKNRLTWEQKKQQFRHLQQGCTSGHGAIQPDVKFGSDTDDAVVLQGLTRQLSNNLHVDILWILLIINELSRFLKARLPIFSCNLALAFRAKALNVNVFCASLISRLFHF